MNSHPRMPAGHGFPHQGVHLKDWKAESPPPIQPSQLWPKFPAGQHDFQPILAHFRTSKGKKPSCPSARQTGNKTRRWGRLWCWLAGSPGWCPLRHKRRLATRHGAWGWDTSGSRMPSGPPCPPPETGAIFDSHNSQKVFGQKNFHETSGAGFLALDGG